MAVNLLLIGRNGNGKSSTGNSILVEKLFVAKSNSQNSIDTITLKSSFKDKIVSVVDGPFIKDTNMNDPDDIKLTLDCSEKAMKLCPDGFHAIIIILKYGVRYTKQEKDAIFLIRAIFGDNVIKNHGICVFTYGDNFDLDNEGEGCSFESWCKDQTGDIADLFKECNNRCVLFNNKAPSDDSKKLLFSFVEMFKGIKYTFREYEHAKPGRKGLEIISKRPRLEEEMKRVIRDIHAGLEHIDVHGNPEISKKKLLELVDTLDKHKAYLVQEASETQLLKNIFDEIKVTEMRLDTKLGLVNVILQTIREQEFQRNTRYDENEYLTGSRRRQNNNGCWAFVINLIGYCLNFFSNVRNLVVVVVVVVVILLCALVIGLTH